VKKSTENKNAPQSIHVIGSKEYLGNAENVFRNQALQRIAVLELSTRACKLLIVDLVHLTNGFSSEVFINQAVLTNTGQWVSADNIIHWTDFHSHILPTIMQYVERAKIEFCVDKLYCVATAAYREAFNRSEILDKLSAIGLNIKILSRIEEAKGTLAALKWTHKPTLNGFSLLIDQGGGSTEVILFNSDFDLVETQTAPVGTTSIINHLFSSSKEESSLGQALNDCLRYHTRMLRTLLSSLESSQTIKDAGGVFKIFALGSSVTMASGEKSNYRQHLKVLPLTKLKSKLNKSKNALMRVHKSVGDLKSSLNGGNKQNKKSNNEHLLQFFGLGMIVEIIEQFEHEKMTINGFGLRYGICHNYILKNYPDFYSNPKIHPTLESNRPSVSGIRDGDIIVGTITRIHHRLGVFVSLKNGHDGLIHSSKFKQNNTKLKSLRPSQEVIVQVNRIVFGISPRFELSLWNRKGQRLQVS
jgi:exopolyphosphatase/pppGpp-phosphohydrolase